MKNFFNSNKLKASNLIQPIFIEEGLKSKKLSRVWGIIIAIQSRAPKKLFHLTLKKVLKILFFLLFQRISKKKPEDFNFHYQSLSQIKKNLENE